MDSSAAMAGGIVGALIGLAIGAVIGGLLIMLGSKIVMGKAATFGSAFIGALASGIVGFVLGLIMGFVVGAAAPQLAAQAPIIAGLVGFFITPAIYSALVKTSDGAKPSYIQGLLIYLIQLAVIVAIALVAIFVFRVQIPGMPVM